MDRQLQFVPVSPAVMAVRAQACIGSLGKLATLTYMYPLYWKKGLIRQIEL
ncbi:hypothetical protein ACJX0J_010046, partial [Zea mays]